MLMLKRVTSHTLMMTATFATPLRMLYHIPGDRAEHSILLALGLVVEAMTLPQHSPMSLALAATGRRSSVTNFLASSRISMMLFSRAKSGASGKLATKSVTKPNWMTEGTRVVYVSFITSSHFSAPARLEPTGRRDPEGPHHRNPSRTLHYKINL